MANYSFEDLRKQNINYGREKILGRIYFFWEKITDDWEVYHLDNCLNFYGSKYKQENKPETTLTILIHKNNNIKDYIQKINEFVYWYNYNFRIDITKYFNDKIMIEKYKWTKYGDDWYSTTIIEDVEMKITNKGKIYTEFGSIYDGNDICRFKIKVEENKIISAEFFDREFEKVVYRI